ncbi:uncharacterized protein L969DRAFT_102324 [Mixia osmundae IAM 14324]|uniref:Uncharacterized protein n=1 Tax=Mixia osmundae (strain CBS 9802 / IAM 14324 / JCM 22182 / KY 12970) TaxID=764103 RepID=G7EAP5_MIXOS|nr:uncharacterized protein L969DRAFT_102324 [Mixia osmundae IAM 14324]KEI40874.1 hypothetical protein L969DRAFT_102324 [Mixia osmundae IAM 14324]GAA99905.1 hypothetical protein E5Q_06608 [Mixia osmundae IAM 14324]
MYGRSGCRRVLQSQARASASSSARQWRPRQAREGADAPMSECQRRSIFGISLFGKKAVPANPEPELPPILLEQDNLFHRLSESPIPAMRERAKRIKSLALCPVNLDKGIRKHVDFECTYCGFPTHATREDWESDKEHVRYWPRLREANMDEHDRRSGRQMTEFDLPGDQPYEEAVSMSNWDVFFYTRGFASIETERQRRHVSKLLTYPISIAGVLHENSPYRRRNQRLTPEGQRSMIALRQTLHPALGSTPSTIKAGLLQQPFRIIIIGSRAESCLPGVVYEQLTCLFPSVPFHIIHVGPEVIFPPASSLGNRGVRQPEQYGARSQSTAVSDNLTITLIEAPYERIHQALEPFDPYHDVFFSFSPGFGFPDERSGAFLSAAKAEAGTIYQPQVQAQTNWHEALLQILETKCALFCTGFSPKDVDRDVVALETTEDIKGEFDWVLTPGENAFGSEAWEVAEWDPRVCVKTNGGGVYGIRGKRYDVRGKSTGIFE